MTTLAITAGGVVAIGVLLLLSSFFSSSEIAIFSLSDQAIADLDAADPRVEVLRELRSDPHRLLVTLLVGNNVVNLAIGSLTTALVLEYLSAGVAVGVATVIASAVVLVFGEIVPKSYGLGHAESWTLRVVGPLRTVEWVLAPLVSVFEWVTVGINRVVEGDREIEKPYLDR
jgi:CBS domain containing-hemolysin-like protein